MTTGAQARRPAPGQGKIATHQVITPPPGTPAHATPTPCPATSNKAWSDSPPAKPAAASAHSSWAATTPASCAPPSRGNRAPDLISTLARVPATPATLPAYPPGGGAANITGKDPDSCPHPDTASKPTETEDTGPPRRGQIMILPCNSDGDDGRERSRPYRRLFARLPSAADYALLSPSVRHYAYGALQRRASVAGRPRPGTAALNELSAPVLTIHDVPHRGMCERS